ncbi:LAP2_3 [Sanghuangporus weigelae]
MSRPRYQRLIIDFGYGENPDDAYSRVPYEKGANLLLHLERMLGGLGGFLPYVRNYVNTFMGGSIDTDIWKNRLYEYWARYGILVLRRGSAAVPVDMEYDLTLAQQTYELAERWNASRDQVISALGFQASELVGFDANQKVAFLGRLQIYPTFPITRTCWFLIRRAFGTTSNAEIRFRFYELALLEPNAAPLDAKIIVEETANWLVGEDGTGSVKGRMKFYRPAFRAVYRADPFTAIKAFQEHKTEFHPIARRLIEKVSIA